MPQQKNSHLKRTESGTKECIRIRGASQNNLKHIDVDIPVGDFTVVTGLSGSGKSSLVFDTLYAEGQRRYVETFSPYARQFLDRMDRPHVGTIEGVPPAIAIDQNSVIRTSRSTVGTMTELNDHLKLLFAHHARSFCPDDGTEVVSFSPDSIWSDVKNLLSQEASGYSLESRLYVAFELEVPERLPLETAEMGLSAQGFTNIIAREPIVKGNGKNKSTSTRLVVAADRFKASSVARGRALEAVETALEKGAGEVLFFVQQDGNYTLLGAYRRGRVCPTCGRSFPEVTPNHFSFNSAVGACSTCRGFGRTIENDLNLIIPDRTRTLREKAVKPFSTAAFTSAQEELLAHCAKHGVDVDTPYEDLSEEAQRFIIEGDPKWTGDWMREWYGVKRFFDWLETKTYKMHVRVMLSRYRSYVPCSDCGGAHLKPLSLIWRYGSSSMRKASVEHLGKEAPCFKPVGAKIDNEHYEQLPGFNFHELMLMPISELALFFETARQDSTNEAEKLILNEVVSRLQYLTDVGLGYLTLDRQGRTLSGGEVQRVNLTTALGTNLVNTLFVLDEPSIGLHPRDMNRVNGILRRLTEAGNTLVVVEHDPQVMLAANRLIDLGPKAGRDGGEIIYDGPTRQVLREKTETGLYLSGKKRISRNRLAIAADTPVLTISHCTKHNLQDLTVSLPLGRFVAVAGVSGSGKSTFVADTLIPLLDAHKQGKIYDSTETLSGTIPKDFVFVDQSPLGRTTRGNPASYVGAFDAIRKYFGESASSRTAGFTWKDFSFNSGAGRCPYCGGAGYEHVEMQFLSDVYLPCPVCHGKHYRDEILAIKTRLDDGKAYNIADALEMTVDHAVELFSSNSAIVEPLKFLQFVGLGYLTLGQPLTTLSGGERQRLKLAAQIASGIPHAPTKKGKIFIFDEPTTGLHFADVAKLVEVFDRLVLLGHSVLVIEHNLDILNCADWVIELGPEGGAAGGQLQFAGSPDHMIAAGTLTGIALRDWRLALEGDASRESFFNLPAIRRKGRSMQAVLREQRSIVIEGAREHNLQNISVDIPRGVFNVITGPSGSGKSTLAFDIIFAEGQRRYLESLNAYARSMVQPPPVPEVDSVRGIAPTVAIEQRTSRGGMRSTVATLTEIYHFLRLLYVKLGVQYCPDCGVPVTEQSPLQMASSIKSDFEQASEVMLLAPIVQRRKGQFTDRLTDMRRYSDWARIDRQWRRIDGELPKLDLHKLHDIDLPIAVVDLRSISETGLANRIADLLKTHNIDAIYATASFPKKDDSAEEKSPDNSLRLYSERRVCPICAKSFPELDSRLFSYNSVSGACPTCMGYGVISQLIAAETRKKNKHDEPFDLNYVKDRSPSEDEVLTSCPDCGGSRLNPIARNVFWKGRSISDITAETIDEASTYFANLRLEKREESIGLDAIREIVSRLSFLKDVGLNYLTLDRSAPTLSGGEAQRIRLAAQLGTSLRGVCYILDEPTIGLHPRDNAILLSAISKLTRKGNTLLVVEHDEETIRSADHVIDIGPGAGTRGGHIMAEGTVEDVMEAKDSPTGRSLKNPIVHTGIPERRFTEETPCLTVRNASANNLKITEARIPVGLLTVVTGVSGSGKSTFCRDVLYSNISRSLKEDASKRKFVGCSGIDGLEHIGRILEVDQTPIGKTPRSCPATYVGFFDKIRALYAQTPEAVARGFTQSRFSFNNASGSCPECGGQGLRTIEMNFLPDVKILCEVCRGNRFNPETLAVTWKGKTIGEVLQLEVDDAVKFFDSMPHIAHPLRLMQEVGLGYLTLGQPSPTLSGGEAQRIKLVTELSKVKPDGARGRSSHTLYVLDEPTVGLHMQDVEKLIRVLQRLVAAGNTVVVIEHNLDVIADADWIIDLGPEGGNGGGRIVAEGIPANVAEAPTETGRALKAFLEKHKFS